jgi:putative endonuclease
MGMRVKEALAEAAGNAAASYLEGCGIRIVDRNWRCDGETLSIVALDRAALVVVDLRVRAGTRHGAPLEAVSAARKQTMRRLGAHWLAEHGRRPGQVRIDVVGLLQDGSGGFTIEHVRAVG